MEICFLSESLVHMLTVSLGTKKQVSENRPQNGDFSENTGFSFPRGRTKTEVFEIDGVIYQTAHTL